jgi:hypothetical protein
VSLTIIHCEECGEYSSIYSVDLPNPDYEECDLCGRAKNRRTVTHHFCSFKCLAKWVKKERALGAEKC